MSSESRAQLLVGFPSRGVHSRISSTARNASGTFTVKIDCQPKAWVNTPPITGPMAVVDSAAMVRMPMAKRGGGDAVASARVRNIRIAAG